MAVVNIKSGVITNRDATPKVLSNANLVGAKLIGMVGVVESAVDNSTGSTFKFFQVPSNAVISKLSLYMDVMDSGATPFQTDVGLYDTPENGGLVVDADFFAAAVVGLVTKINGTDITHQSGVFNIDDSEKMVWQALGLNSDPKKFYDVVATTTGDNDTAGTICLKMRYKI